MASNLNSILNYLIGNNGRTEAGAISVVQIAMGVFMLTSKQFKIPGVILVHAGLAGGYYVYRQSQESFQWVGYKTQNVQGAVAGTINGAFGYIFQGAGTIVKLCSGVIGGFFSAGAAEASGQLLEHSTLKDRQVIIDRAYSGGVGAFFSSFTGVGLDSFAPTSGVLPKVAFETFKGTTTAAASKMATNFQQGKEILDDVVETAILGGGCSGLISTAEQFQLSRELAQAEQALLKAQADKAHHENVLKNLQETTQAKEVVLQKEQLITDAKKAAQSAAKQLDTAEKLVKQMRQSYEYSAKHVDDEVKSHLARGYKARIKDRSMHPGHFTQSANEIREAMLNGKQVQWCPPDPSLPSRSVSLNPYRHHHKTAEVRLEQTRQTIKGLETTIAQNVVDLQVAQARLNQCTQGGQYLPAEAASLQKEVEALQSQLQAETAKVKELEVYARNQSLLAKAHISSANEIFSTELISYVDCDMNELISHVVLVHAVCQDTVERFPDYLSINFDEQDCMARFLLERLFTPDGHFGQHLQMEKREFVGKFEQRPQTHWAWNQLVQANSGAFSTEGWEGARIGILVPLSSMETSQANQPFAVAPYDTQVFGSFRLPKGSIILVPAHLAKGLQDRLTDFQGQVVGYDPSKNMRTTVMDTLFNHYPETWHICNSDGELIGGKAHYTIPGYETKTCIKTTSGMVYVLLHNEGKDKKDQLSRSMRNYQDKAKRYIGLHVGATTYVLESKPYFNLLKLFANDMTVVKKETFFAGQVKTVIDVSTVGALEAFAFYRQLIHESTPQTGCYAVANYVLKEAIFADVVSLFFQMHPDKNFELSSLDLHMMVSSLFPACKRLLGQMEHYVTNSDQVKALELFKQYCALLQGCLADIEQAQLKTMQSLKALPESSKKGTADFSQAKTEWDQVVVPESTAFDLGKNWPLAPQLHTFVSKIFHLLPKEQDALHAIYHQLVALHPEEKKEQFRLNVLCSTLQWAIQEQFYLKVRQKSQISPLAILLAIHQGWLKEHHLETVDFTKSLGDCLFDNVIAQAPDIACKTVDALRNKLVQFMAENPTEYQSKPDYRDDNFLEVADGSEALIFKDWNSYLECLSKPQVWATELEIQALSVVLQRPIVLVSTNAVPKIYNAQGSNIPIFLNHKNWNHYESCRPLSPHTSQEVYTRVTQEPHY
jgi:hypothetical protein